MGAIRLLIDPELKQHSEAVAVIGGKLRLSRFGPRSPALGDQERPAKISFFAGFLEKAQSAKPDFKKFATLAGTILQRGSSVIFAIPSDIEFVYTDPPPQAGDRPPRQLELGWASDSFNVASSSVHILRLPPGTEHSRHIEVGLELEIEDELEAALDVNDLLDVPLAPLSYFRAHLADDAEQKMTDQPFELQLPDGSIVRGTSDDDGVVYVNPVMSGSCVLKLLHKSSQL